jgi:hypothetical protein
MKNQILNFVLVAAIVGSIAAGCSSQKNATNSSDSSAKMKDSTKMNNPAPAASTPDTAKRDTTKH